MLPCLVSVLLTFQIQGVLKFERKIRRQKVKKGLSTAKEDAEGENGWTTELRQVLRVAGVIVHIARRHGLDGPGIESRWGGEIFRTRPDQPWGPSQPPVQ